MYKEYKPSVDETYYGSVGLTADFTFTAGQVTDVAGWYWGWANPPGNFVAAPSLGASKTLLLTPPPPSVSRPTLAGTLTLYVRSVDRTGIADGSNSLKTYIMRVGEASAPVSRWELSDPPGATSLADSSGNGRNATATDVVLGAAGRLLSGPGQPAPTAGVFNGSTSSAATAAPVVDTSKSFSMSAWVRPDTNGNDWRTVLSARGVHRSAVLLRRDPTNKWTLTAVPDDNSPVHANLTSVAASQPGVWTHLAGVYDQGAGQIRLYVNGVLEASTPVQSVFRATGPVEFGRDLWNDDPNFHARWQGGIAEAKVWNRVASTEEIASMAATQVGEWALNGHGGDSSGWGRTATPAAVSWVADRTRAASSAGGFNGTSSVLSTTGPAVRSDQSYTVALWARLSSTSGWSDAVAQKGARDAALILQFDPGANRWAFAAHLSDVDSPATVRAYSTGPPQVGVWTHLAGVYDAQTRQLRLYVNGVFQQAISYTATWHAPGPVLIGADQLNAATVSYWRGELDDVRIFAGALPASEVFKLYQP